MKAQDFLLLSGFVKKSIKKILESTNDFFIKMSEQMLHYRIFMFDNMNQDK